MTYRTISFLVFSFYVLVALLGAYGLYRIATGIKENSSISMQNREMIQENRDLNKQMIDELRKLHNRDVD